MDERSRIVEPEPWSQPGRDYDLEQAVESPAGMTGALFDVLGRLGVAVGRNTVHFARWLFRRT